MHAAAEDTTLFGYAIPKGTMFIANIWGVHNDPDTWPNPDKFDPGRFLDGNGHLVENKDLIPFSAGRRICLGENLARIEIFLFITHILHQFELSVPEGEPGPSLEGIFAFNYSTKPFKMTAKKRDRY
ncbi:cytochrome P450 2U1-like [Amphiura filiformis]|uniref:cytochrome P450 2U1-like n=1 Tax=Amphiura filiformis TaxID=82378 RepID=UPI003B20FAC2